jgi:NAD(P)-dependent dehydrogenase (short-subunit alcohol dehydrogenase family)
MTDSRRVGKAIALHLAESGFDIGVHFLNSDEEAIQTQKGIEALGRNALLLQADLTRPQDIAGMFDQIHQSGVELSVLVNSAAVMPRSDLMKITWQEWDQVINANLRSVWLMCQQAARVMKPGGIILNISDAGADLLWTGYGAYVLSKKGVNELTRLMAKQLAPAIRVNGIAPGLLIKSNRMSQEEWEKLRDQVPMKSAGDMQSFLATIDLLINNEYITGEVITLSGGASLG